MSLPFSADYINSYYSDSRHTHPLQPTLQGKQQADVCIVGGGLAGLCAALPLAENGQNVILIEAGRIGSGASGRNGGQALSDYACGMQEIEHQLGEEAALWFWQQSYQAVQLIEERIQRHQIQCDWQRGYATVAIRPHHMQALSNWHETARRRYGIQHFQLWDAARLQTQLASERYAGALFDPHSGHLHPLNYTLGLAQAAQNAGARIFEHSPLQEIHAEYGGYRIDTPNGQIRCQNVILAVNTAAGATHGHAFQQLDKKILPVSTFMIATEPLGERAAGLIRNRMAVCDNRHILDYYRLSADNRLLFGGKDSEFNHSRDYIIRSVRRDMLKVFPQLEDAAIDYAWGGQCDISMNLTPHFGRQQRGLYFMQGFCGHGLALTGIAGLACAEAILGDDSRLTRFEQLRHRNIIGGRYLRKPIAAAGATYYRLKDLY